LSHVFSRRPCVRLHASVLHIALNDGVRCLPPTCLVGSEFADPRASRRATMGLITRWPAALAGKELAVHGLSRCCIELFCPFPRVRSLSLFFPHTIDLSGGSNVAAVFLRSAFICAPASDHVFSHRPFFSNATSRCVPSRLCLFRSAGPCEFAFWH